MKSSVLSIILILCLTLAFGQESTETVVTTIDSSDSEKTDTTKIELKNAYITIISKSGKTDNDNGDWNDWGNDNPKYQLTWWNGVDIGLNGILSEDFDLNHGEETEFLKPELGKSRYIAFNLFQIKGRIVKDYVGLTTGLTFQIYSWKYGGSNEFVFAGDSLYSVPSGEKNISKNKLRAEYIGIPLLLEFNTSLDPDRAFHISAGAIGKIRLGNMYKQKYELDGSNNKTSIKGDLGFNQWQVDAMLRIGYKRFTLYGQFGLMPLFDNGNTPDVYSFSTGIFIKV